MEEQRWITDGNGKKIRPYGNVTIVPGEKVSVKTPEREGTLDWDVILKLVRRSR